MQLPASQLQYPASLLPSLQPSHALTVAAAQVPRSRCSLLSSCPRCRPPSSSHTAPAQTPFRGQARWRGDDVRGVGTTTWGALRTRRRRDDGTTTTTRHILAGSGHLVKAPRRGGDDATRCPHCSCRSRHADCSPSPAASRPAASLRAQKVAAAPKCLQPPASLQASLPQSPSQCLQAPGALTQPSPCFHSPQAQSLQPPGPFTGAAARCSPHMPPQSLQPSVSRCPRCRPPY